jgi:hypothetical protein
MQVDLEATKLYNRLLIEKTNSKVGEMEETEVRGSATATYNSETERRAIIHAA